MQTILNLHTWIIHNRFSQREEHHANIARGKGCFISHQRIHNIRNIKVVWLQVFAVTHPDRVVSLSVWSVRWKERYSKIERGDTARFIFSGTRSKTLNLFRQKFQFMPIDWLYKIHISNMSIALCNKVIIHCQYSTSLFPFALTDALFSTTVITCTSASATTLCMFTVSHVLWLCSVSVLWNQAKRLLMSHRSFCLFVFDGKVFFSKCAMMVLLLLLLLLFMLHFMVQTLLAWTCRAVPSLGGRSLISLLPSLCCTSVCLQEETGPEPIRQISR